MRRHARGARPLSLAVAWALLALAAGAGPAFAAIDGSLAPSAARPGEWVELTTDAGAGDPNVYASIAKAGSLPIFLQQAEPSSPGNSCGDRVGDLAWTGGVGHLRFQVPDVPSGTYWVLATVDGACWRFGDTASGVLTLTVLPAANTGLPVALVGVAGLLIVVVVGGVSVRRHRRAQEG